MARSAIAAHLEQEPDFTVVAASNNPRELLELSALHRPELTLLDSGSELDGVDLCRRLVARDPDTRILILERNPVDERVVAALWAGARGVAPKERGLSAVMTASRQVLEGRIPHSDEAMRLMLARMRSIPRSGVGMRPVRSSLTDREWEVLDLLTLGGTTDSIASELFLSTDTVLTHIKNILRKTGATSRAEVVGLTPSLRWPDQASSQDSDRGSDFEHPPEGANVGVPKPDAAVRRSSRNESGLVRPVDPDDSTAGPVGEVRSVGRRSEGIRPVRVAADCA